MRSAPRARAQRILHVGSGFRPMRLGGFVTYIEELMDEQVRRGLAVTYFFAGRYYPYLGGPRLKRWRRGEVAMLEVVNSPLYDHGRQPELELDEPRTERLFERVLREVSPDIVHFHELAGLPSSILDVAERDGIPSAMTLADYFPLCSTFKLIDAQGHVCLRREVGADCVAATAADTRPPGPGSRARSPRVSMRPRRQAPKPSKTGATSTSTGLTGSTA